MPQGWDFPKGSFYGSFISDFNRNKVRPALRPFESLLTYFAYLDCECFRAGLCLPLHLLYLLLPHKLMWGNVCAYHSIWIIWMGQGHSHMAAGEMQVTFLASPLTQITAEAGLELNSHGG